MTKKKHARSCQGSLRVILVVNPFNFYRAMNIIMGSRRLYSISSGAIVSKEEAVYFLTRVLGISSPLEKVAQDRFLFLKEFIPEFQMKIPFQSISLLSTEPYLRRRYSTATFNQAPAAAPPPIKGGREGGGRVCPLRSEGGSQNLFGSGGPRRGGGGGGGGGEGARLSCLPLDLPLSLGD